MNRPARRPIRLESLSERLVPAGSLVVTLDYPSGLLNLTGTEGADIFDVRQENGEVRVGGHSITWNIPGWAPVQAASVPSWYVRGIRVNAGGGDDSARFQTVLGADAAANSRNMTLSVRFDGGRGNDTLVSAGGNDTLIGGEGTDTLDAGEGNDTLFGDAAYTGVSMANVDDLLFITAQEYHPASGNDTLRGGGGADTLYGGFGNDVLFGGAGGDTLYGMSGQDFLLGEDGTLTLSGSDLLLGGAGSDWLFGEGGRDVLSGGADGDWLYGGGGQDSLNGGDGHDRLHGEGDTDWLYAGEGNDQLDGGDARDYLYGEGGDDALSGGEGDDFLYGGYGRDSLYGQGGADRLDGGPADELTGNLLSGGLGMDTYVIYWDTNDDTIFEDPVYWRDRIVSDVIERTIKVRAPGLADSIE